MLVKTNKHSESELSPNINDVNDISETHRLVPRFMDKDYFGLLLFLLRSIVYILSIK